MEHRSGFAVSSIERLALRIVTGQACKPAVAFRGTNLVSVSGL